MNDATIRPTAISYFLLAVLTIAAVVIQVRLSAATVHAQRSLDYSIPFLLEPFSATVTAVDYWMNWERGRYEESRPVRSSLLRLGDRIVKVNGQSFGGLSFYLTQLWDSQHRPWTGPPSPAPPPFWVTAVKKDGRIQEIEFGSPHCTCGTPEMFEAVFFWGVAPLFCLLAGALTAAFRPHSVLAWSFFGLMLSLSQLQSWNEPYVGFQLTADPAVWADGMRVPAVIYREFVQNVWPVTLIIAALHLARKSWMYPLHAACIAAFLLFALASTSVEVAWSEGILALGPVHYLLERYGTEALALAFALVTAIAWNSNRRIGLVAGLITICAAFALFLGAEPITNGERISYSDQIPRFELIVPEFHRSPKMIVAVSVTILLLTSTVLLRRRLSWFPAIVVILNLPLAAHVCGSLGDWWNPFLGAPVENWRWIVVIPAGIGIALASVWIVKREARHVESTG